MFFTMGGALPGEDAETFVHKVSKFLHEPNLMPYVYLQKNPTST